MMNVVLEKRKQQSDLGSTRTHYAHQENDPKKKLHRVRTKVAEVSKSNKNFPITF